VARQVGGLAAAAVAVVLAQQASTAVVVRLANSRGSEGALGVWTVAWTVFLLPWAVLAVPLATSAFPRLAAHHTAGEEGRFSALTADVARTTLLVSAVAGGVLAGVAPAVARVVDTLTRAIVAFVPGLLGYALVAHFTRVLYARSGGKAATLGAVLGWVVVVVADLLLVANVATDQVVTALGAGNSIGMTVAGAALLVAVRRAAGPASTTGVGRAAVVAVLVGLIALLVGRGALVLTGPGDSIPSSLVWGSVAAVLALAAGAAGAWALARADVDRAVGALQRGVGR
jgi:putative peptidoglycan lipid II flippase